MDEVEKQIREFALKQPSPFLDQRVELLASKAKEAKEAKEAKPFSFFGMFTFGRFIFLRFCCVGVLCFCLGFFVATKTKKAKAVPLPEPEKEKKYYLEISLPSNGAEHPFDFISQNEAFLGSEVSVRYSIQKEEKKK